MEDTMLQDDESAKLSLPLPSPLVVHDKSDRRLDVTNGEVKEDEDKDKDDEAMNDEVRVALLTELQRIASETLQVQPQWEIIAHERQVLNDAWNALQAAAVAAAAVTAPTLSNNITDSLASLMASLREALQLNRNRVNKHEKWVYALDFDAACFRLRYSHQLATTLLLESTNAAALLAQMTAFQLERDSERDHDIEILSFRTQYSHLCHKIVTPTNDLRSASGTRTALAPVRPPIPLKPEVFPMGYSKQLGEALLYGRPPQLTSMAIRMLHLLPDGDDDEWMDKYEIYTAWSYIEPLVRYVQTDAMLCRVQLLGTARDDELNAYLVEFFLEAAAANPYVQEVEYDSAVSAFTLAKFLQQAIFVKSLKVDFQVSNYYDTNEHVIVHDGFAAITTTLEKLTLRVGPAEYENPDLIAAILRAFGTPLSSSSTRALKELTLIGPRHTSNWNDDIMRGGIGGGPPSHIDTRGGGGVGALGTCPSSAGR